MIYFKVISFDCDTIFCTTIENEAYFFVINRFIDSLNSNIHNGSHHHASSYFAEYNNTINQTIDAINNKEYESAYFFCKNYLDLKIETEDISISAPIISSQITKTLNTLNKEMVFK